MKEAPQTVLEMFEVRHISGSYFDSRSISAITCRVRL